MEKNEQGGEEQFIEEDLTKLDDSTDWKAKAEELEQKRREEGIRNRERTKALRDQLKTFQQKPPEEKVENKKSDNALLEKVERIALRAEGITHTDDIELARNTAKKWGVDIDEVLADEDFKAKLGRQQTARANAEATSNIKGGGSDSNVKNTPEYWASKGVPPTREQVPDRKTRAKIARAMMSNVKSGKKFYND